MLDENLPTFYLRASTDNIKHNATVLLSQQGSDAVPEYSLRHPDPALPASRNRYAAALYDSYNPEILFGEVLLIPEWSQHKASAEEIRLNGGVPPAPQPVLPTEFVVQLYNPDQQVTVRWHASTWTSAGYWEFEIPQQSFRQPSVSAIDRTQSDPTASDITPKLSFKWKKEGKLSKDYVCSLSDKSTNPDGSKRKNREPDITVALFRSLKEITVYEPNLSRVEIEDPKGFEVVLLLGAIVIREVFHSSLNEAFNISDATADLSNNPISPLLSTAPRKSSRFQSSSTSTPANNAKPTTTTASTPPAAAVETRPPPTDPRTQWVLDAEAARLKKQVEREQAEQRRADAAETKRVKRMLEEEERKERERRKEIDRETERLKKIYGKEERKSLQQLQKQQQQQQQQLKNERPPPMPARHSIHGLASLAPPPHQYQQQHPQNHSQQPVTAYSPAPVQRPHSAAPAPGSGPYIAHNLRPPMGPSSYSHGSAHSQNQSLAPPSSYGLPPMNMSGALSPGDVGVGGGGGGGSGSSQVPPPVQQQAQPKKSFWRMRGVSESEGGGAGGNRLRKERSMIF